MIKGMKIDRLFHYIFLLSSLIGCDGHNPLTVNDDSTIHILFVGNSLTYTNDLPQLVKQEAHQRGLELSTEMIAFPNYALEDHWQDGAMQKRINNGTFDFVIVQQGPSSQSDGREMLLDYGARIKGLCDQNQAKLVFFMVWPARSNWHTFLGVIQNYTEAATATQSILCPVGLEWKKYIDTTDDYSYYGSDQFHPSPKGSQIAAELITKTLLEALKK